VREATVVVAPNAERARRLSAEVGGGRYVHTVWNCPRRPAALRPRKAREPNAPLNVLYCGSVNEQRLPRTVIDAISRAETPVVLQIAGYETGGSRGYIETLLRRGATIGVGQHVHALGPLSEAELYGISDRADVGLALMPTESTDINMRHMVGASNKVFEYLAHGLVPLVSDFAEWRSAFVDPGYAMAVTPERVDSLADAFNWAADHRGELRAIVERGFARLQHDWNYEAQFAPVMRRMLDTDTDPVVAAPEREAERCAS